MDKMINDIVKIRGQEIDDFGEPRIMDEKEDFDPLLIDTADVLKELQDNEVVDYIAYDPETEEDINFEDLTSYMDYIEDVHGFEEVLSSNTFNGSAPVSNHMDFTVFKFEDGFMGDKTFVELKTQLGYGDVRGNYTDTALLEFESEDDFYEKFLEAGSKETKLELDDREFLIQSSINQNIYQVFEEMSDGSIEDVTEIEEYPDIEEVKILLAEHLDIDIKNTHNNDNDMEM